MTTTHYLAWISRWFALASSAVIFAGAQGCGGDAPLPPAHSSSFFPVRGTTDNGAAAGTLHWVYRINGGQALPSNADPSMTIRFGDEQIDARDGSTITTSLGADLTATGASGHESVNETDHLTPGSSPATADEKAVDIRIVVTGSGMQENLAEMLKFSYGSTPLSTFFDRDDLDSLAIGFADTQTVQAVVTGSATATVTGAGTQTQSISMTLMSSTNWTLVDQLATFQVLGHDYANVVKVQTVTQAIDPSTGVLQEGDASIWLAKGIGVIRQEQTGSTFATTGPVTSELVSTNLAP
jgi:hypothetical protein